MQIIKGRQRKPRRVLLYGQESEKVPGRAWRQSRSSDFEDGLGDLDVEKSPRLTTTKKRSRALTWLYESEHEYQSVVFDTVDWFERLLHQQVCRRTTPTASRTWAEATARAYTAATELLQNVLQSMEALISHRKLNVVILGIARGSRSATLSKRATSNSPDLHKGAAAVLASGATRCFSRRFARSQSRATRALRNATHRDWRRRAIHSHDARAGVQAKNRRRCRPSCRWTGPRIKRIGRRAGSSRLPSRLATWRGLWSTDRLRRGANESWGIWDLRRITEATQASEVLPAGDYAIIVKSQLKPTKNGDGQYLELKWQILTGPHKNRNLWSRLNIENKSEKAQAIGRGQLSAICRAVNVLSVNDSSEPTKPLKIVVKIGDDDNNNRRTRSGLQAATRQRRSAHSSAHGASGSDDATDDAAKRAASDDGGARGAHLRSASILGKWWATREDRRFGVPAVCPLDHGRTFGGETWRTERN